MKHVLPLAVAMLLAGCATTSKKHAYTDTSSLVVGKTTAAECRALFGEPKSTRTDTGADGKFEILRYGDFVRGPSKAFARVLLVEFKDGSLNGFASASSFPEDRSTFVTANLSKIEWAASTKDETRQLLGKPHGIMRCPTKLFTSASKCTTAGREIWVYEDFHSVRLPAPVGFRRLFTGSAAMLLFDEHNLVTQISNTENSEF